MRDSKRCRLETSWGFTLVEMMVTMVAAGILALTAGSMLLMVFRTWRMNEDAIAMQTESSLAMKLMAKHIRHAGVGEIEIYPNEIRFAANSAIPTACAVFQQDDDLMCRTPDSQFALVDGRVEEFTAVALPARNGVELTLRLVDEEGFTEELHSFVHRRN